MALAYPHLKFLYALRKANMLPAHVRLMEFGEQNWFGDVPLTAIVETAREFLPTDAVLAIAEELKQAAAILQGGDTTQHTPAYFKLAELYYRTLFAIERYDAVDLHGMERSLKYDLNQPLPITDTYNLVVNFGTGEHVFNQYSFFQNMHNVTEAGGLMLHSFPNQGCFDHGFFNYHPTFIFDLAHANNYIIQMTLYADLSKKPAELTAINRVGYVEMALAGKLSAYSGLLVCLRKMNDAPFVTPQQGYYSNHLPEQLREAWEHFER